MVEERTAGEARQATPEQVTTDRVAADRISPRVVLATGLSLTGRGPQREAELRELTAGEILDASQEGEVPIRTAEGYQMVSSPAATGMAVLRRQIVRIGEVPGPLPLELLRRLTQTDLQLLQAKADELDQAAAHRLVRELAARGRGAGAPGGA